MEGDAYRAALQERERSKLGRMARLRGGVETLISETPDLKEIRAAKQKKAGFEAADIDFDALRRAWKEKGV
jgi:hypothetical protein